LFVDEGQALCDYIALREFDFDNCLIYVNGFQKDKDYVVKEDDVITVRQFASGALSVGTVVSLVGAGIILGGTGLALVLNEYNTKDDLSQLETSSDTTTNNTSTKSVPSISGASNSSQYGKPYPFVMGKHLYTPMYLGKPYTTISGTDGEDEYYHGLYLLGYNDIDAYNFSLGTSLIASNQYKEIDKKTKYNFKGSITNHFNTKKTVYTASDSNISLSKIVDNCTIYALVPSSESSGELTVRVARKGYTTNERKTIIDENGNEKEEIQSIDYNNIEDLVTIPNGIMSNVDTYDNSLYSCDVVGKYTSDDLVPLYYEGDTYYGIPITIDYDLNVNGMTNYNTLKSYLSVSLQLAWDELHQVEKFPVRTGSVDIDGRYGSDYGIEIELQDKEEVGLYPQKVTQENLNIEMTNVRMNDEYGTCYYLTAQRFSASYPQKIEVEFTVNGLCNTNNDDNAEIYMCLEYSKDGGTTWQSMTIDGWETTSTLPNNNIHYASGMSSSWNTFSVLKRSKNKVMRFVATKEFTFSDVMNFNNETQSYENALTNNVVELRIRRANVCSQTQGRSVIDKIYLTAIRTWSYDYNASIASNSLVIQRPMIEKDRVRTTRVGFQIKATDDLEGNLDAFNCIVQSRGRYCTIEGEGEDKTYTWSATTDVKATRNPASIALLALQSCMRGKYVYDDSRIDLESFGKFYEWCDAKGYYSGKYINEPRFTCDGVLTNQKKTRDIINDILACGRGYLVLIGKKYGVMIDCPKENPTLILNNQNILSSTHKKAFTDLPDGYNSSFINEENRWSEDDCSVYMDESDRNNAEKTDLKMEKLALLYQTRWCQVWSNLRYELAKAKLRPEIWYETVGTEGNLVELGDLISVQTDTLLLGIGDGAEVTGLIYDSTKKKIIGIECDGNFDIDDTDAEYGVKIQHFGDNYEPVVIKKQVYFDGVSNINKFYFVDSIETRSVKKDYQVSVGDLVSFGLYGKESAEALLMGKKSNKDGTFDLTLVPYSSDVYLADTYDKTTGQIIAIPDFDSKVTTPIQLKDGDANVTQAQLNEIQRQIVTKVAESVQYLYNSITITLYKESSEQLTDDDLPTCNATYSFADDSFTFADSLECNGWSRSYPSNHTNPVYITSATAFGKESTDTITANEWATPILSGNDGVNGYNTHTINLYKRSTSQPADNPDSLTYHFDTGMLVVTELGNSFNGWSTSIPSVTNSEGDVWEIHATALSTTLEDEILSSDWSEVVQITMNDGLSEQKIKELIQDSIDNSSITPTVSLDAYGASFYVNSLGYTTVSQQVEYIVSVKQGNEDLEYIIDSVDLPNGFSYTVDGNKLTIYVSKDVRIGTGFMGVTISYKYYKTNYVLGYETTDETAVICYTGVEGTECTENEILEYAIGFQSDVVSEESKTLKISYSTITGNKYLGAKKNIDEITSIDTSGLIIGDYFTYTGTTIASDLAQTRNFVNCKIYTYVGEGNSWSWEVDTDKTHMSGAMTDILAVATTELESNNSDAYMYLDKLVTNKAFVDLLVANEAFIKKLVSSSIIVQKDNAIKSDYTTKVSALDLKYDKLINDSNTGLVTRIDNTDSELDSLRTNVLNVLGFTTEGDLEDWYKETGNTIIEGGYIKTGLIESDYFKSKYATIDYITGKNAVFTGSLEGGTIIGSKIMSKDYDSTSKTGFLITEEGRFECSNGLFKGSIDSGPLKLNVNPSSYSYFSANGSYIIDVYNALHDKGINNGQNYDITGTINGIVLGNKITMSTSYNTSQTDMSSKSVESTPHRTLTSGDAYAAIMSGNGSFSIVNYFYYYTTQTVFENYSINYGSSRVTGTITTIKKYKGTASKGTTYVYNNHKLKTYDDDSYLFYPSGLDSESSSRSGTMGENNFTINPTSYSFILTNLPKSESSTKGAVYAGDDGILRISR